MAEENWLNTRDGVPPMNDRFLKVLVLSLTAVGAILILSVVFTAEYITILNERHPPMTLDPRKP